MFALLSRWCQDRRAAADHAKHSDHRVFQAAQGLHPVQDETVVHKSSGILPRLAKHVATVLTHGLVITHRSITPSTAGMEVADGDKDACAATVLSVFPDICLQYLEETATKVNHDPNQTIDSILSSTENGAIYPKASRKKSLKRKRGESEDDEEKANLLRLYASPNRLKEFDGPYINIAKMILKHEFPRVLQKCLLKIFSDKDNQLLPAYLVIDEAVWNLQNGVRDGIPLDFALKKTPTPPLDRSFEGEYLDNLIKTSSADQKRAFEELVAARRVQKATHTKRAKAKLHAAKEAENFENAKAFGTVTDCGCCFGEFAVNRMVCCENEIHVFCVDCARRNAETAVGLSKYELLCMSTDGCSAGFSRKERLKFIDDQLSAALDRIESEAVLRMAGIENLETCPFCPYAAEYPSVDINKEFKCDNPECQLVSCRLCREETHLPRTCEEAASDGTEGARRQIEEAMSTALIRKCNKCGMAFVKESGCNKMTCTKQGCRNIQCYVCSKSCDYDHFDDRTRGGKQGNCPLFDDVNVRHNEEVQNAEAKARQEILERHPSMKAKEDLLKVTSAASTDHQENRPNMQPVPAQLDPNHRELPIPDPPPLEPANIVRSRIIGPYGNFPVGPIAAGPVQPLVQGAANPPHPAAQYIQPAIVAPGGDPLLHRGIPFWAFRQQNHRGMLEQRNRLVMSRPDPVPEVAQIPRNRRIVQRQAPPAAPRPSPQELPIILPPAQPSPNQPILLGFEEQWGPLYGEPRELKRQTFRNKGVQRPPDIHARQNFLEKAKEQRASQWTGEQSRQRTAQRQAPAMPQQYGYFGGRNIGPRNDNAGHAQGMPGQNTPGQPQEFAAAAAYAAQIRAHQAMQSAQDNDLANFVASMQNWATPAIEKTSMMPVPMGERSQPAANANAMARQGRASATPGRTMDGPLKME
ncbi:ubiquitin-conjugating enzyme [Colletotrichum orchidophilum]|uniref:Ubiquitin-conjugating enzyme n=1 Tax=Colletotrichum orchidophilum TaxID=1209926 RepID=A0A1G4BGL9_9PEZI|nr:ubiquitin-conjugating enzyme [Colletotrichum orchidophilum]OHF00534.1 ubiquitin-conjugating enzyme [Colletotrichum orchidophilum]